jgi:Tol biopolymer transport system component
LVYARADGRSDIQLRRQPVSGDQSASEQLTRTNGLPTYAWMPDGRLLFSQLEQDGPDRVYADLYLVELDGGTERVTRGARLEQPSVSPDGNWAVAVQNGDGTNALVRVDLGNGAVSPLVAPEPDVHWAFPRVAPDGRWIAATRWDEAPTRTSSSSTRARDAKRTASRAIARSTSRPPGARTVAGSCGRRTARAS